MTKKELSQLYNLNREIELNLAQKEALKDMLARQHVSDTVIGSALEFPYTQRVFKLEGIADTRQARRVRQELEETLEIISKSKCH